MQRRTHVSAFKKKHCVYKGVPQYKTRGPLTFGETTPARQWHVTCGGFFISSSPMISSSRAIFVFSPDSRGDSGKVIVLSVAGFLGQLWGVFRQKTMSSRNTFEHARTVPKLLAINTVTTRSSRGVKEKGTDGFFFRQVNGKRVPRRKSSGNNPLEIKI